MCIARKAERCQIVSRDNMPSWSRSAIHDDVIKWKHFPRYLLFVRGVNRSPVNSPNKGQWRGAVMFPLIWARINGWVNNRKAGDLRRRRAHYDVTVMHIGNHTYYTDTLPSFKYLVYNYTCIPFMWLDRDRHFLYLPQMSPCNSEVIVSILVRSKPIFNIEISIEPLHFQVTSHHKYF